MLACVRGGKPVKGHKTHPYRLGGLRIDRPNQVWCSDITYLPMRKGFPYLVAIRCPAAVCLQTARGMDWFTRKVLAWRITSSLCLPRCTGLQPRDQLAQRCPRNEQWQTTFVNANVRDGTPIP